MSLEYAQRLAEDESESDLDDETSPMKALVNNQLDQSKAKERKQISLQKIIMRYGSAQSVSLCSSLLLYFDIE